MNTLTAAKIVGGVCGSLLVFLLIKWGSDVIFQPGEGDTAEAAYVIEVAGASDTTAPAADTAAPTFATLLASADVAKGEKTFGKCKACHRIAEGKNATGPSLYGVVGRAQASIADFNYSDALKSLGGTWTPENLNTFLTKPKDYAPGTKMSFAGLKKETDRANLIAYLATIGG